MKVLNLYAGIGGNRKLWDGVDVTAVEIDSAIAGVYQDLFPYDKVVIGDAHEYLLHHYNEYDFIWSSPPCPTHSQYRFNVGVKAKGFSGVYPDMSLYQEVIFLAHHFDGLYVVENVISYYDPLIKPQTVGRHYMWTNFEIDDKDWKAYRIRSRNKISDFSDYDLSKYKISNKRQILRNCVDAELGKHVLDCALKARKVNQ